MGLTGQTSEDRHLTIAKELKIFFRVVFRHNHCSSSFDILCVSSAILTTLTKRFLTPDSIFLKTFFGEASERRSFRTKAKVETGLIFVKCTAPVDLLKQAVAGIWRGVVRYPEGDAEKSDVPVQKA